jgi:hypothetical protein
MLKSKHCKKIEETVIKVEKITNSMTVIYWKQRLYTMFETELEVRCVRVRKLKKKLNLIRSFSNLKHIKTDNRIYQYNHLRYQYGIPYPLTSQKYRKSRILKLLYNYKMRYIVSFGNAHLIYIPNTENLVGHTLYKTYILRVRMLLMCRQNSKWNQYHFFALKCLNYCSETVKMCKLRIT